MDEIRRAAGDAGFRDAMAAFYARLDAAIAARAPVCTNRGACCRFGDYGHNLFVSAVEVAYFLAAADAPLTAPPDRSFCSYQQGGRCTARAARPAGCRIYFCDTAAQDWQPRQSEAALRELAAIGERFGVPYVYLEWTDALRLAGGTVVDPPHDSAGPTIPLGISIDSHERPS